MFSDGQTLKEKEMNTVLLFLLMSMTTNQETLNFEYAHKQGYDTSCGFSALSGLLSIYWNIEVSEDQLISNFFAEHIGTNDATNYFVDLLTNTNNLISTLADLSILLSKYGIANKSYKMTFDELKENLPNFGVALIHYDKPQTHFLLLTGMLNDDSAVVMDSVRGMEILSREEFCRRWSGTVLLTASKEKQMDVKTIESALNQARRKKAFMEKLLWEK